MSESFIRTYDFIQNSRTQSLKKVNVRTKEPTGFLDRTQSTLSFDESLRRLTLTRVASSIDYYIQGDFYQLTDASYTYDITDTEGFHYFYMDSDELIEHTSTFNMDLIYDKAYVAYVYWSVAQQKAILFGDERHGCVMDGVTHGYLHTTRGASLVSGGALGTLDVDGDGDSDEHSEITVQDTNFNDEDILHSITGYDVSPALIPVIYRVGSSGYFQIYDHKNNWVQNNDYSLGDCINEDGSYFEVTSAGISGGSEPTWTGSREPGDTVSDGGVTWTCIGSPNAPVMNYNGGGYRLAYNRNNSGTWEQTEISNNSFVLTHIIATNDWSHPIIAIQGINLYANTRQARDGALVELTEILNYGLPFPEYIPLASIIYKTSDGMNNQVKAAIISTDTGDDYIDWRSVAIPLAGRGTIAQHSALLQLDYISSGHSGFQRRIYMSATSPTANNDIVDTAGLGRTFEIGDEWFDTSTDTRYLCKDNTATAAVWV